VQVPVLRRTDAAAGSLAHEAAGSGRRRSLPACVEHHPGEWL